MMKYAKIFFLSSLLFLGAFACKKKDKTPVLPNGKYIGVFTFESTPEKNYTGEFIGFKSDENSDLYDFVSVSNIGYMYILQLSTKDKRVYYSPLDGLTDLFIVDIVSKHEITGILDPSYGSQNATFSLTYQP